MESKKGIFQSIDAKLRGLSPLVFALVMSFLLYIPIAGLALFCYLSPGISIPEILEEDNYVVEVVVSVVLLPIISTFIFQHGIIKLFRKWLRLNNILLIFISAIIFGLSHYLWEAQIIGFFTGLILAYSYVIYEKKTFPAFWMVTILHAIRNLPIAFPDIV